MGQTKKRGTRRKCRQCGQFNDLGAAYCSHCGVILREQGEGRPAAGGRQPSHLLIFSIIILVIAAGLTLKIAFSSRSVTFDRKRIYQEQPERDGMIEKQVYWVASNFKCACGGCGELPLVGCNCDMPRGALEEKAFIREELMVGHSVEQVIQLVEGKYGLRIGS